MKTKLAGISQRAARLEHCTNTCGMQYSQVHIEAKQKEIQLIEKHGHPLLFGGLKRAK
jgi:hypothetical protein